MGVRAWNSQGYRVEIMAGNHRFVADEPSGVGTDSGPTPYDMLLGALASCTAMTVRMYAERKAWPLEGVEIGFEHRRIHAADCQDCVGEGSARVEVLEGTVSFHGELTDEQRSRLLEIARRCPVHLTLVNEIKIRLSGLKGAESS